jgi:hypothetical protein
MARYQILYWKDIPAQVKAADEGGRPVSRPLPDRFQAEIDQVAMREGLTGTDQYLDQWRWTEKRDREGSAEEVLQAVIHELEREFSTRG